MPKNLQVGQYAKEEESEQLLCQGDCGGYYDSLIIFNYGEPPIEMKMCEGCHKKFWLQKGWKV